MKKQLNEFLNKGVDKGLSWTTVASEKLLLALIGISTCLASALYLYEMLVEQRNCLNDVRCGYGRRCEARGFRCALTRFGPLLQTLTLKKPSPLGI